MKSHLRWYIAVVAAGVVALVATVVASASDNGSGPLPAAPATYQPGDQVWFEEPTVAGATLDAPITETPGDTASSPMAPPPPPRPWQPGDKVWTTEPPVTPQTFTAALTPLFAFPCERVPATGYISRNVYARTANNYNSNYWTWSAGSSSQAFHWYIITTGGTIKAHGESGGGSGSQSVSTDLHYWKVQNHGTTPQAWNVCPYLL